MFSILQEDERFHWHHLERPAKPIEQCSHRNLRHSPIHSSSQDSISQQPVPPLLAYSEKLQAAIPLHLQKLCLYCIADCQQAKSQCHKQAELVFWMVVLLPIELYIHIFLALVLISC